MQAVPVGYVAVHDTVHLVVNNVSSLSEIDWVNDLIVPIVLITIQIFSLTSVTRVMEEKRIVWTSILH